MSKMPFFDSHCHFDFSIFDEDREMLWDQCQQLGLVKMIIPSVSPAGYEKIFSLCERHDGIYMAAGLHPWWVSQVSLNNSDDLVLSDLRLKVETAISNSFCVALGECGLDGAINTPLEKQLIFFKCQLEIAAVLKIPLIIHALKAHNSIIEQLKYYRPKAGGVVHGFSGSYEMAMDYWRLGFRLGIGGVITYDRAKKTQDAIRRLPIDSLVLETDAPDMPPEGCQGKRNTPLNIVFIAKKLAEIKSERLEFVVDSATRNTLDVFKLWHSIK